MPNISMDGMAPQGAMMMGGEPQVMESSLAASQLPSEPFEVTYRFKKPVLIRGYVLETANERAECDPKDWILNVHNCEDNVSTDIHEVNGEGPRDRWIEKLYRIPEKHGKMWVDRITLKVSATQEAQGVCEINQFTIMTDESVIIEPEGYESRKPWEFRPNMEEECLEFKKLEEMYPVDCENALSTGFLKVFGTQCADEDHSFENATNKAKNKYRAAMIGGGVPPEIP